jgi:predicted MarR family transcription regulator
VAERPTGRDDARSWHMTPTAEAHVLVGAEFGIIRTVAAFQRASESLMRLVSDVDLSFNEIMILHVTRMHDRAKDAATIASILSRDDLPNVLYNLRKLVGAGLVEKARSGSATVFAVTDTGRVVTDRYSVIRRQLLLETWRRYSDSLGGLAAVTESLTLMAAVYEAEARSLASVDPARMFPGDAGDDAGASQQP